MARVKIDETILEDVALTVSGGRLCLRWAADAWDGTLDSAAELLGVASELRELDADDQHGDARHHRPGVSGGYHHRLCRGGRSQHRRWLRNAVAAHRGRSGADSIGRKPSRWMGGRRGGACADGDRNALSPTCNSIYSGWQPPSWRDRKRYVCTRYGIDQACDDFHGKPGVLWYFNSSRRSQLCPQQHAAVAGRGPLEARGLSYTRKGAAV